MSKKDRVLIVLAKRMVSKRISGPKREQQEDGNNHVEGTFIVHHILLGLRIKVVDTDRAYNDWKF